METLLRNIVERSRKGPEPTTDEAKKKAEMEPIRGKITHAFLYTFADGGEDKNPAAGTFRYIRSSIIDPIMGGAGGQTGMGEGGGAMPGVPHGPPMAGGGPGGISMGGPPPGAKGRGGLDGYGLDATRRRRRRGG